MVPDDRLVCALVRPLAVGDIFQDWPLHITIVPWFRSQTPPLELARLLQQQLVGIEPFRVDVDGEAAFGYRGRKQVNLITLPSPIIAMEEQIRRVLKSRSSWIVDESTKKLRSFRPHITFQRTERLHAGDSFQCGEVYIIEQKGGHKVVAAVITL